MTPLASPPPPPLLLPTVGACGVRVLDGVRFACEIVDVAADQQTLTVRFLDDAAVEHGVEWDEFELHDPLSPPSEHNGSTTVLPPDDRFLRPLILPDRVALSVLGSVVRYFEPFEWLGRLVRVCRQWRTVLLCSSQWQTLSVRSRVHHVTRLLDTRLDERTTTVSDVLEAVALDGSDVVDDHVVSVMTACPRLQSIRLRRCHSVSFLVVYELLRLSRERHAANQTSLQSLDLWLCRGISPTFVAQLTAVPRRRHASKGDTSQCRDHPLKIVGPGFYFVDVSTAVFETLEKLTAVALDWPTEKTALDVLWVPETAMLEAIAGYENDPAWKALQRHGPLLKAASLAGLVPLVRFDLLASQPASAVYLAIPVATVKDLTRLINELEPSPTTRATLHALLSALAERDRSIKKDDEPQEDTTSVDDPLAAQAERVFASLHHTTEQLQRQVEQLESQVAVMAAAKREAEREYKHAERELQRVAHEADRAVLRLATSSDGPSESTGPGATATAIDPPPQNGVIQTLPEDALLPPLPSHETIASLATALEQQYFAILDAFVGVTLSARVRQDVELLYTASRNADTLVSVPPTSLQPSVSLPPPPSSTLPPPAPPAHARFTLGELAGGSTGRNLRYQMAHVRGDYMLWLDQHDAWCPPSVRLVLRQLDRLVLEHLSVANHELSMSALLRKKAMVTCYPGRHSARYTRHCDNPNRNGRKLTAIWYLNADWDATRHGGELKLYGTGATADGTCVAPILDRLVLFFSDARVPHEVLPCQDATRDRFALTVWYLDYDEYMHAQVFGTTTGSDDDSEARERRRIEQEIERLRVDPVVN